MTIVLRAGRKGDYSIGTEAHKRLGCIGLTRLQSDPDKGVMSSPLHRPLEHPPGMHPPYDLARGGYPNSGSTSAERLTRRARSSGSLRTQISTSCQGGSSRTVHCGERQRFQERRPAEYEAKGTCAVTNTPIQYVGVRLPAYLVPRATGPPLVFVGEVRCVGYAAGGMRPPPGFQKISQVQILRAPSSDCERCSRCNCQTRSHACTNLISCDGISNHDKVVEV